VAAAEVDVARFRYFLAAARRRVVVVVVAVAEGEVKERAWGPLVCDCDSCVQGLPLSHRAASVVSFSIKQNRGKKKVAFYPPFRRVRLYPCSDHWERRRDCRRPTPGAQRPGLLRALCWRRAPQGPPTPSLSCETEHRNPNLSYLCSDMV